MGEAAAKHRMTVDEFLRWEGEPDVRYELVGGVPIAMNPPMSFHRIIAGNAAREIGNRLRSRRPCRVEIEAGVWLSEDDYCVADLAVTCAPVRNAQPIDDAALVIEILSASTRTGDLGRKIPAYMEIASVREIWAIDSERRRVWVYRREGERWVQERYVGSATFRSDVLDDALALDDLYENTDL